MNAISIDPRTKDCTWWENANLQQLAIICFGTDIATKAKLTDTMDIIFGNSDIESERYFFRLHGQLIAGHAIVINRTDIDNAQKLERCDRVQLTQDIEWVNTATAKAELCMQSLLAERALISSGVLTSRTSDYAFSIVGMGD